VVLLLCPANDHSRCGYLANLPGRGQKAHIGPQSLLHDGILIVGEEAGTDENPFSPLLAKLIIRQKPTLPHCRSRIKEKIGEISRKLSDDSYFIMLSNMVKKEAGQKTCLFSIAGWLLSRFVEIRDSSGLPLREHKDLYPSWLSGRTSHQGPPARCG
jgi:hypothetical protein